MYMVKIILHKASRTESVALEAELLTRISFFAQVATKNSWNSNIEINIQ